jgi:hypothetical protein
MKQPLKARFHCYFKQLDNKVNFNSFYIVIKVIENISKALLLF